MKTYEWFQNELKKINLSKEEIKRSKLFLFLSKYYNDNEIFFSNINSMCLKTNPSLLRIRNDKFLYCSKNKKNVILFTGIKYKDKSYILCFLSKCFYGYEKSVTSSNSFINFQYDELINKMLLDNQDNIVIKNLGKPQMYIFYISNDKYFNENNYLNFVEQVYKNNFNPSNPNDLKSFSPPIPDKIKLIVRLRYKKFCARVLDNKCPCGNKINLEYLQNNKLSYTDIHHFAPKELMIKKMNDIIDWKIIHNQINLIPLCSPCHQAIHKGGNYYNLVKTVFISILECYKLTNSLDDFKNYIKKNLNMNLSDLFNFYINQEKGEMEHLWIKW